MSLEQNGDDRFGKDISRVVSGGAQEQKNGTVHNLFSCIMVLDLNVFCPRMEDGIECNSYTTLVVVEDGGRVFLAKSCIEQKASKPNCFTCSTADGLVLSLSGGEGNRRWLFVGPRNSRRPNGEHVAGGGASGVRITCPVGVTLA